MSSSQKLQPWSWSVGGVHALISTTSCRVEKGEVGSWPPADRTVDECLCLVHERIEVGRAVEALRVNLVDVFRAGGARREPSVGGHDLQAADRRVIAGSPRQLRGDRLA